MSAFHRPADSLTVPAAGEAEVEGGGASSSKKAEPHSETTQSGASRSVSPARERIDWRFLEAK